VLMIWIGVYPSSFMRYSEQSTRALVAKLEVLKFGKTSYVTSQSQQPTNQATTQHSPSSAPNSAPNNAPSTAASQH
jgi:hypothetical protein